MGKVCSKCVKGKYKEKDKPGPKQVQDNKDSGKILTNKGVVIDPRDISDADIKQPKNDTKQPEEKPKPKKKKKRKPETSSDDSSDSSSSSSDSDEGYSKSTRKVKRNRNGGTTIVSKVVNVNGQYTKIQNVDSVVLTINSGQPRQTSKPKPKKPPSSEPVTSTVSGPCKEFFSSYHNKETVREEMRALNTTVPGDTQYNPVGFYTSPSSDFEDAYKLKKVLEMAGSVCKVVYPGGFGTGIRVGESYVMMPWHVLDSVLGDHRNFAQKINCNRSRFYALKRKSVFAIFNYDREHENPIKFSFDEEVHFMDKKTDIAIVKLQPSQDGHPMPPAFKYFTIPVGGFIFIGHPNGQTKKIETVKGIIQLNDVTKRDIVELRGWSLEKFKQPYDDCGTADSINRVLFKSNMISGASGSPGLVLIDDTHVAVATIFLHKYPDWIYDQAISMTDTEKVPENFRISQGANMFAVYMALLDFCPELCDEVFHPWQD